MKYHETCRCEYCGNIYGREVEVFGDYDPPDVLATSKDCTVCRSTPFKKLEEEVRQLKKKLRARKCYI